MLQKYDETVKHGIETVPEVQEIKQLFPMIPADNFISNYGFDRNPAIWNTQVFFGGRYTLTYQVSVLIDYDNDKIIKVVAEPKFSLEEVSRVFDDTPENVGADFVKGNIFGTEEWNKVIASKGDFSVIGIYIKTNAPVPRFDDYVRATRAGRNVVVY
jgi:hypothetical protein